MPYLTKTVPSPEPIDCRILGAALALFVEKGFHKVSIHEIQNRANVSIGSIYNHFGGKEGIAKALYYHLLKEITEMVDTVLERETSAIGRCNRLIELMFEYTETRRNIISFVLRANHDEFLPDEPPICSAGPFAAMREIVNAGMRQGEIRQCDPWVASAAVFGPPIRMIHLRLDGLIAGPLPDYLEVTLETVWGGLRGPAAVDMRKRKTG